MKNRTDQPRGTDDIEGVAKCEKCGADIFSGATDCPRCGNLVGTLVVENAEPHTATAASTSTGCLPVLGAIVAGLVGLIGLLAAVCGVLLSVPLAVFIGAIVFVGCIAGIRGLLKS